MGRTPPRAMVTPARSLLSCSSFLPKVTIVGQDPSPPDSEVEVARDDPRLLVTCGVASQLEDLGGQLLHHRRHVDGGAGADSLCVVALPVIDRDEVKSNHLLRAYRRSLWILPTVNWRPALLDRDLDLRTAGREANHSLVR